MALIYVRASCSPGAAGRRQLPVQTPRFDPAHPDQAPGPHSNAEFNPLPGMPATLLSRLAKATADVRGNLGPAARITEPDKEDWIHDRWQAAADMNGTPIPGPHWVQIDLGRRAAVSRVVLDWETAYAKGYDIQISDDAITGWTTLFATQHGSGEASSEKHIVHDIVIDQSRQAPRAHGRFVRININQLGTAWGASLWEVQVYGHWIA